MSGGVVKVLVCGVVRVDVALIFGSTNFGASEEIREINNIIIHTHGHLTNHECLLGSRASPTFYDIVQKHIGQLRILAFFIVYQPFSDVLSISNIRQRYGKVM